MTSLLDLYDLFCFDFDGLLVDSEALHKQAYELALAEFQLRCPVEFFDYCFAAHHPTGDRLKDLYTSIFPQIDEKKWSEIGKRKQKHYYNLIHTQPLLLMPQVDSFLEFLLRANKSLCVVTNSSLKVTLPYRKSFPILEKIPLWITRDDVQKGKPHPDGYLKALSHFAQIPKSRVLALEDALKGVTAILNAEITPLLVCPKQHPQLAIMDSTLKHIESLGAVLA